MLITLIRFLAWLRQGYCMILDRDADEIIPLRFPRVGQLKLIEAMIEQARSGRPVRIIVPKYRRHGLSTMVQAFQYFMCWTLQRRNARTVAHTDEAAKRVFAIAKIIHEFHPAQGKQRRDPEEEIEFKAGKSKYKCISGIANFASSGDTIHSLHISEFAKFPNTTEQDRRAMRSMVNAISQTRPDTMIVIESSGQGPVGEFPERCRKAEEGNGSFRLVFVPWLWDPSLSVDEDELPEEFDPVVAGYELLLRQHGATDGQIAWRRQKLHDDFPSATPYENPPGFAWDYPLILDDCFAQRSGRVYPMFSMHRHVQQLGALPSMELRRWIDWGFSSTGAYVCLWVSIDRSKPPQLIVHPGCKNFIAEHLNYARDPRTGRPVKSKDHSCDAFRYGIVTNRVTCLVYVYRELFSYCADEQGAWKMARTIHEMSGWHLRPGANPLDLSKYVPGPRGEQYEVGVADKALGWLIKEYRRLGIPLQPYVKPDAQDSSHGEIEDGIRMVEMLMSADGLIMPRGEDARAIVYERALAKLTKGNGLGRALCLSKEERAELDRRHPDPEGDEEPEQIMGGPGRNMLALARCLRRV